MKYAKKIKLQWKVNTVSLLKEVMNNPGTGILVRPFQIFTGILEEVAERALELNDLELNALMCRLALYEQADGYSKDYDPKGVGKVIDAAQKIKAARLKKNKPAHKGANEQK